MTSRAILTFVLLVSATLAAAPEGGVSFWGGKVTLRCPGNGTWFKVNGKKVESVETESTKKTYEYKYTTGSKDHYYCKYNDQKYHFYIQGKACEYCFELDGLVLAGVIVVDVIGTVVVMLTVYKCTKKKKKAAASPRAAKPVRRREEIPIDSNYAPLSVHTRSSDYSVINRTG
ncbi:unnamed protein product [Knipowitschia caucasica]|uniref:CD3 gamma/delta subunit Ig-like domain-containing protein n=1 Tax=Knipowitschia caucasica TaxID=637954 RepID=A0AAV2J2S0_KNICA